MSQSAIVPMGSARRARTATESLLVLNAADSEQTKVLLSRQI